MGVSELGSGVEKKRGVLIVEELEELLTRLRDFKLDLKLWEVTSFFFLGVCSSVRIFMLTSCRQEGAESDLLVKLCRERERLEVTRSRSFWREEGIFIARGVLQ